MERYLYIYIAHTYYLLVAASLPAAVMTDASRINLFLRAENQRFGQQQRYLPVTVITGFLGSGKTTLVRHILENKFNLKVAVAVNDFAEVNLDHALIKGREENEQSAASAANSTQVVALSNGCVCCSVRGPFEQAVAAMIQQSDAGEIEYLVIEASGVSDPVGIIRAVEREFGRLYRARLDSVVAVADTDDMATRLLQADGKGLAEAMERQFACADVILLNKWDLVAEETGKMVESALRERLPPGVAFHRCEFGRVPLSRILAVSESGFDQATASAAITHESMPNVISIIGSDAELRLGPLAPEMGTKTNHLHEAHLSAFVVEASDPLDLAAWQDFLGVLPSSVVRAKGFVFFTADYPRPAQWSFQLSGRRRFSCEREPPSGAPKILLVFIGHDLDEVSLRAQVESCLRPAAEVASIAAREEGGRGEGGDKGREATTTAAAAASLTDIVADRNAKAAALVRADDRLELLDVGDGPYVAFRLTGVKHFSTTKAELTGRFGVNFERVTEQFASALNGSSGQVFVTTVHAPVAPPEEGDSEIVADEGQVLGVRYALNGQSSLEDIWPAVEVAAAQIIDSVFAHVTACNCGW